MKIKTQTQDDISWQLSFIMQINYQQIMVCPVILEKEAKGLKFSDEGD